jgi:Patatin-like phospholipase
MKNYDAAELTRLSGQDSERTSELRARLLFSEALLEEYESLDQPPLDQNELQTIKAEIQAYRHKRPDDVSEETVFGGVMMKRIYELINKAQREQARKTYMGADEASSTTGSGDGENGHQLSIGPGLEYEKSIMPKGKGLATCTLRSALCLSGGGVRSATFNLGILQGLARHGLLDKFDYLSTVSGGGFIGGWLSAWIRRAGMANVVKDLKKPPETPWTPDPPPVEHLRIYSNYLSPQPGLLSADTWTLVASVVRNLLLNWLVFVPVLLALLMLPRMWASIVLRSNRPEYSWYAFRISLVLAFLSGVWALSYIGRHLPSSNDYADNPEGARYKGGQGKFVFSCLSALVLCAGALAVFLWVDSPRHWHYYAAFLATVSGLSWLFCFWKIGRVTPKAKKDKRYIWMLLTATVLIVGVIPLIIGFIGNYVVALALPVLHQHAIIYSIFSVPFILLLMGLQAVLIAGFASRFSKDDDQEWWARAGAWVLIVALAWSVVHLLVLYGPLLLLTLGETFRDLQRGGLSELEWSDWGKLLATLAGIVSGAITLFGGVSSKTPANSKEAQKAGTGGLLLALATQLLAPVFLGFLIIVLSLVTNWIIISWPSLYLSEITRSVLPPLSYPLPDWHIKLLNETTLRHLLAVAIVLAVLGAALGRLISTNVFSLQYLWRNRIIRAYLGASHPKRHPDPFTGFDSYDNLQMHELWPQPGKKKETYTKREDRPAADQLPPRDSRKLFHILNMALNLTGGEKLQWQDRKAESFTVSPLHAGSYWLGYRRSKYYGGSDGITLGASIAISGAFVSPNMGFMMNSPVVRFLMAVFNVRFGWWLGNPGPAGEKTFQLDSPRLSVLPFFNEAIGNTDDKAPYVYLSDGGHFENLGLYEMILRRCRFIVVCDATTDPDYAFESLAMSIRQIRVDLGVPIEIPEMAVGVPSQNLKSKYCAVGRIRYSCVDNTDDEDPDEYDGVLIFIKPSLIGQEPRDVINYWQAQSSFPQEAITDQWFSEAQFESYRALGSYIIETICKDGPKTPLTLETFAQKAHDHTLLNFDAFREQIGLIALENQFKRLMEQTPVATYQDKVREFMNRLLR